MSQQSHDPRRFVCIHGHFYQPPRENPWIERVEVQESAHPYHDWNERIDAECYGPNATSRILDDQDRIADIVNNYASISFNFGPTLLSWLERHSRSTYDAILEADRLSIQKFSGHGSAMAQVYSHAILPLCNARDQLTQVRWGIQDFKYRFGRAPEGMWLSETAVDLDSLEVLAQEGIRFTVLAPSQAAEFRKGSDQPWINVSDEAIDTRQPWRLRLESGREITLFFYDGGTSQAVAFERLLSRGDRFAQRLTQAFDDGDPSAQLVHIATDGETYGHHHRFGDMALAWAIDAIDRDENVRLTNYSEYQHTFPPQGEVRIRENTAWSCSHLLGRWTHDCGCSTGGHAEWTQGWRAPLRRALDFLRDSTTNSWEQQASKTLTDPWAARDAYIDVVLNRNQETIDRFLEQQATHDLRPEERVRTLSLLELQRNALLMYTSCGWFFDDLSGIETTQVLQYAGRTAQLAEELLPGFSQRAFLASLAEAQSNDPSQGNGRDILEATVKISRASVARVAINHATAATFGQPGDTPLSHSYDVDLNVTPRSRNQDDRAVTGQITLRSQLTEEHSQLVFALFHSASHEFLASVATGFDDFPQQFDTSNAELFFRELRERPGGQGFGFDDLFRDEQRTVMHRLLESTLLDVEEVYRGLHQRHAALLRRLSGTGSPQLRALRLASELVLNTEIGKELSRSDNDPQRLQQLLTDAREEGIRLDATELAYHARIGLQAMIAAFIQAPTQLELLQRVLTRTQIVHDLPFHVDLRDVENRFYEFSRLTIQPGPTRPDTNTVEWNQLFREVAETLRIAITGFE